MPEKDVSYVGDAGVRSRVKPGVWVRSRMLLRRVWGRVSVLVRDVPTCEHCFARLETPHEIADGCCANREAC